MTRATRHLVLPLLPLVCAAPAAAQSFHYPLIQPASAVEDDQFGLAVDVAAPYLIGGTYAHDHEGEPVSGGAWMYTWSSGQWVETAQLIPSDGAAQDLFGTSVAVTDGYAFIGAPGDDDLGSLSGSAYVFETVLGTWTEVAKLTASDGSSFDDFGQSVAVDGEFAVVGAPRAGAAGSGTGQAYVFQRQAGSWNEVAVLIPSDGATNDSFGWDVAIDGDRIAVGARWDDTPGGFNTGSAYVFERQPDTTWAEVAKLTASDGGTNDYLGEALDLSGDRIVCGAWRDADLGIGSGSAYVFERQSNGSWSEAAKLNASDGSGGDNFGFAVGIYGDLVAVGAHNNLESPYIEAGAVYTFVRASNGTWFDTGFVDYGDGKDFHLGVSIAVDEGFVAAGAWGAHLVNEPDDDIGAIYPYYAYSGSPEAPISQGTGTPGCDGPQTMAFALPPHLGSANFAFTCDNAPPSSSGFLALGQNADLIGNDVLGLGFLLHLDPFAAPAPLIYPGFLSDADGNATFAISVPNLASLLGITWHAQSAWIWSSCSLPPFGFSSSDLLSFQFLVVN